jgi:hypothetical protein
MLGEHLCEKHQNKIREEFNYRRQHMQLQSPNHFPKALATIMLEPGVTRHCLVDMYVISLINDAVAAS